MSKLDGIKAGDRVRVVMEGEMVDAMSNDEVAFQIDGHGGQRTNWLMKSQVAEPTFQITRIEPAFKVGDGVLVLGRHRDSNETVVGFLKDGRAIVEYEAGDTSNVCAYDISCLTHA